MTKAEALCIKFKAIATSDKSAMSALSKQAKSKKEDNSASRSKSEAESTAERKAEAKAETGAINTTSKRLWED